MRHYFVGKIYEYSFIVISLSLRRPLVSGKILEPTPTRLSPTYKTRCLVGSLGKSVSIRSEGVFSVKTLFFVGDSSGLGTFVLRL